MSVYNRTATSENSYWPGAATEYLIVQRSCPNNKTIKINFYISKKEKKNKKQNTERKSHKIVYTWTQARQTEL